MFKRDHHSHTGNAVTFYTVCNVQRKGQHSLEVARAFQLTAERFWLQSPDGDSLSIIDQMPNDIYLSTVRCHFLIWIKAALRLMVN